MRPSPKRAGLQREADAAAPARLAAGGVLAELGGRGRAAVRLDGRHPCPAARAARNFSLCPSLETQTLPPT
jgi:hypothetical protein